MIPTVTIRVLALAGICLGILEIPARAATEPNLERMATCQDSWLDWKDDSARMTKFADELHAGYKGEQDGYLVPTTKAMLFGMPVTGIYPESIGMGVGFSVMVSGDFTTAQKAVEKAVGKPLKCEPDSDNMHGCQVELGPKKTVTVMTELTNRKTVLIGCFYLYEK